MNPADQPAATSPAGTLDVALAHARALLASSPKLAIQQAGEILKARPGHAGALVILAEAWQALGDHYTVLGETAAADAAYALHIQAATRDPRLLAPAAALAEGRIAVAEHLLREHLKQHPTDVPAIRMLAEVAGRLRRYTDAENLLARCLELAPGFAAARQNYALVLHRQNKPAAALEQLDQLLAAEPRNPGLRNLKAAVLGSIGEYGPALDLYAGIVAEYPTQPKVWMSYGHALKTAGRREDSIAAYRKCIGLKPGLGEAWWSLANLKTFRFSPADLATIRSQLGRQDLTDEDRLHFQFALGKALEDAGEYAESFRHYAGANRLRRAAVSYDAEETSAYVQRCKELFTREFLASHAGTGCPAPDPVFIVGLPRSGSTLVEQILASHPLVEGTMELPDLVGIVRRLGGRKTRDEPSRYPGLLPDLEPGQFRALGEEYLERTRIQRKTGAPFFIDKLPNNWAHTGLIHLILPNARIIDARRHPLSCCFSGFKQHFARGQHFTYSLPEIGRYYRDYVELMAWFDAVLPGRVHRVIYEQMVADTEGEVRRLLDYCGLPFDERCLEFWRNDRAVRTASSEQVRRPIYQDALEQWRHYDAWLAPLRDALGPVLETYPAAPDF
ncbi:MAG: sulfotransferase [Chromatiales bacterium]|nr:sulfotransferase [Chromatiales bacterium]